MARFERERFGGQLAALRAALEAAIEREHRWAGGGDGVGVGASQWACRRPCCRLAYAALAVHAAGACAGHLDPAATPATCLHPLRASLCSARTTANTLASSAVCERAEMACEEELDRQARQALPSSGRFKARYDRCAAAFTKVCVGPALANNKGGWRGGGGGWRACVAQLSRRGANASGWAAVRRRALPACRLPSVPPSCPRPPRPDRLAKAWARESARFERDYNDRLLSGMVMIRCEMRCVRACSARLCRCLLVLDWTVQHCRVCGPCSHLETTSWWWDVYCLQRGQRR